MAEQAPQRCGILRQIAHLYRIEENACPHFERFRLKLALN